MRRFNRLNGTYRAELAGVTQEDTPAKLRYMAGHLGMNQNDGEISVIVMEELQAYFAGQKTADETAKVIQNRAQLYLNEMKD